MSNFYDSHHSSNASVATTSFAQPPPSFSEPHALPSLPGSQESYISSRDTSVEVQRPLAATSDKYDRWCFFCRDHRRFTTLDGLRRHAAEHLMEYSCIPDIPVNFTNHGPVCVYCSVSTSDPGHLGTTHFSKCNGTKYTRLNALKNHLRDKHNVRHGSVLAEHFKYKIIEQKHFACGFCVLYCDSLNDLVNHIDTRHYRRSEHIRDWDNNKVIRGLLRQPVIIDYWQDLLAENRLEDSSFTWNPADAKRIRERLEMSAENAEILHRVAIDSSNYGVGQHGHIESMPITGLTDLGRYTSPSNQIFGSPAGAMGYDADPRLQPLDSPDRSESFMHHRQHPAYLSSTALADSVSRSLEGQAGISHNVRLTVVDPRSRAHADFVYPTLTTQITPSPMSRNRGSLSQAHHSTYNPGYRPPIAAQSPHPEMTDDHGTDTAFDSDNQQHFMQRQDHNQRQRRWR